MKPPSVSTGWYNTALNDLITIAAQEAASFHGEFLKLKNGKVKRRGSKCVAAGVNRLIDIHVLMDVFVLLHGETEAVRVIVMLESV